MSAQEITKKLGEHITENDLKDLEQARTDEEVEAIFKDIQKRESDTEAKPVARIEDVESEKTVKEVQSEAKPDAAEQAQTIDNEIIVTTPSTLAEGVVT